MRSSGQAGPPSAWSALSRMRAWASLRAEVLPPAVRSWRDWRSSVVNVTKYFFIGGSSQRNPMRPETAALFKSTVADH